MAAQVIRGMVKCWYREMNQGDTKQDIVVERCCGKLEDSSGVNGLSSESAAGS